MKKRILLSCLLVTFTTQLFGQNYPTNYFSAPVDPPLILTGVFGEIRENHFHTGVDFRTGNEEEGIPIMASADGFVSRVKVAADGYGKALYLSHPNGFVSVYGHLQKFSAPINEYVRSIQYQTQKFELDENPEPTKFIIKKGDVIGYSGNTGNSGGTHLHFEIRDGLSEEPINPLLFGFDVRDTIPPVIERIRIFPVKDNGIVEETDSAMNYEVIRENGKYILNTEYNPVVYGTIAFGISAYDYQIVEEENTQPELGIYSAELYVDDSRIYSWNMDRLNFETNRDVNAHIDYQSKIRDANQIERLHFLPGNLLKIYTNENQTGYSIFTDGASHAIKIVVKDFIGNATQINFKVRSSLELRERPFLPKPDYAVEVNRAKGLVIRKPNMEVIIPENALYRNAYFEYSEKSGSGFLSDLFRIGDMYEPIQSYMTVSLKPNRKVPDSLKAKAVMVYMDYYGQVSTYSGQWGEEFFTSKVKNFGDYALALDTVPPVVEKYYTPADMENMFGGKVIYKIKDELSGIKSYSGKIDGNWCLFEFDKKSDELSANVDPYMGNAEHSVEITVTDERGNTIVWKSSFYY